MLPKGPERRAKLILAMIVSRMIAPASKLATARGLDPATAASSLGEVLGFGDVDEDELYAALDALGRQPAIEKVLGQEAPRRRRAGSLRRHLELPRGPLLPPGQARLQPRRQEGQAADRLWPLCAADGCPVAVEVFDGDTADPETLAAQIAKLKDRFGLTRVALVGDRGMITQARLDEEIKPAGLDWITALRAPAIRALLDAGAFQLDLFDERDMASITSPDYPGERLMVCRNPELARLRARKREDLLSATERHLAPIREAVRRARNPLRGKTAIALKVGAVLDQHKMAKHFDSPSRRPPRLPRKAEAIAAEAALDGLYVCGTILPADGSTTPDPSLAYKGLSHVERGFRYLKIVRPRRPTHPPSLGPSRPRPCLLVHARLLRRSGT